MWTAVYSGETAASPAAEFALLSDPLTWPEWDESVTHVDLDGAFVAGTRGVIVFPDGTELAFQVTWVEVDRGFTNETPLPDAGMVVRVRHELTPVATGTRITYSVEVDGPDAIAAEVGAGVSANFPAVITSLSARAERLMSER